MRDVVLKPARCHQLHAHADADEGLGPADHLFLQHLDHAGHGVETPAAILEGADAGKNNPVAVANCFRIGGHENFSGNAIVARRSLEGFGGGVQVSRPVVDDGNAHRWPHTLPNRPNVSWA